MDKDDDDPEYSLVDPFLVSSLPSKRGNEPPKDRVITYIKSSKDPPGIERKTVSPRSDSPVPINA